MEPTQQALIIDDIRSTLADFTGKRLRLKANLGRSKIVVRDGTLIQAHPSLFVVEVDEKRGRKARQSYQYVDVLTKTVELTNLADGKPLFPALDAI